MFQEVLEIKAVPIATFAGAGMSLLKDLLVKFIAKNERKDRVGAC